MYMFLLMNEIVLLVFPHGVSFAEKQNYQYQKSFQTQHHRMPLDLTRFRCLPLLEDLMIFDYL